MLCENTMDRVILMKRNIKTYSELCHFTTFKDRFNYLKLSGKVGEDTFGFDRIFNQMFYGSKEWKDIRNYVIVRDNGCDLGIDGYEIAAQRVIIHHMNPIVLKDIDARSDILLNPEYLITTTHATHNAIHYGDENQLVSGPIIRTKNDTCPWKH